MKSKFECNMCGLCCRNIHLIDQLKDYHNGDGICMYLDLKTNLCAIYENRPIICNVEKSYQVYFSQLYTEEEYIEMNHKGCKVLWQKERVEIEEKKKI